MKLILTILCLLLTTSLYSQIKTYILQEDFGGFKKGDTICVMSTETRDDIYEVMNDADGNEKFVKNLSEDLADAKRKITYLDSVISNNNKIDSIREKQISNATKPSLVQIKGVYFEGTGTYIPKGLPIYEVGVGLNINVLDIVSITPGFKAIYHDSEFNIGPSIRLGVKIY